MYKTVFLRSKMRFITIINLNELTTDAKKYLETVFDTENTSLYDSLYVYDVDGKDLASELSLVLKDFEKENIQLVTVIPLVSVLGLITTDFSLSTLPDSLGGLGGGYTSGVIIIGKTRDA